MSASYQEQARATFAVPIVTSRLAIHPWQQGEEKAIADFLNADAGNFPHRSHHYLYNPDGPFDEERVRAEVFPAVLDHQDKTQYFELYARTKTDQRIIGMVNFSIDRFGQHRVSYYALPSERRKGYVQEAYAACVNHAVEQGFLSGELYAHTDPDNTLSQKFLCNAGFDYKGRAIQKNNQNRNIEVVAFTRPLSKDNPIKFASTIQP